MSQVEQTANEKGMSRIIQWVVFAIIALIVLYSDVMFVSLMWKAFPGGFMTIAAVGGAFATGVSIILLMLGKKHWFRPGEQLICAWLFTAVEIVISSMNVIVSVMVAKNADLGYLSMWVLIAPATPLVSLIGWIVITYLDQARKEQHERMEMDDEQRAAKRQYDRAAHRVRMNVQHDLLSQYESDLMAEAHSPENLAALRQGAKHMAAQTISSIIGRPVNHQYIGPGSVEIQPTSASQSTLPPAQSNVPPLPAGQPQITPEMMAQFMQQAQKAQLSQASHVDDSANSVTGQWDVLPVVPPFGAAPSEKTNGMNGASQNSH